MRLYGIREDHIRTTVEAPDRAETQRNYRVAFRVFEGEFAGMPVKVVYALEDPIFIVTAYPLKKTYAKPDHES